MISSISNSRLPKKKTGAANNFRLVMAIWVTVAICIIFTVINNPYQKDEINLFLGSTVIFVGLTPLSFWLYRENKRCIPIFEMHMLFYVFCFGVAAFVTPGEVASRIYADESIYTVGLISVLVYMSCMMIGYKIAKSRRYPKIESLVPQFNLGRKISNILMVYLFAFVVEIGVRYFKFSGLNEIIQAVRLFAFVWCLHAAWAGNMGPIASKVVLYLILPVEVIFNGGLLDGYLAGLLVYGQIVGVVFIITRRKIPITAFFVVIIAYILITPLKQEYRAETWYASHEKSAIEKADLFFHIATNYYYDGASDRDFRSYFDQAYTRINHLHTTAGVIDSTPSVSPFRHGETIIPLFSKFIPRIIWPNKPREDIGNRWAKDYGYLDQDNEITSFNLPWLPESYMNFGWIGVVGFGLAIGGLIGVIRSGFLSVQTGSAGFAVGLLISSSFFFPESNLSLQVGRMVSSAFAAYVVLLILRRR